MNELVAQSQAVLAKHAASFRFAARFLPADAREDAAVAYAFCRLVDDTVDEADDPVQADDGRGRPVTPGSRNAMRLNPDDRSRTPEMGGCACLTHPLPVAPSATPYGVWSTQTPPAQGTTSLARFRRHWACQT